MFADVVRLHKSLSGAAIIAALLTACAEDSPDRLVASALTYLAQGEPAAATIQVRNAVRQSPENGALRLLLGRALLEGRDLVAAEQELRKATQYGEPPDAVLPLLARAMLEQGDADRLIDEFGARALATAEPEAAFKSTLGHAHLQVKRLTDAANSFGAAAAAMPGYLPAQIGLARVAVLEGRTEQATQSADRLVAEHPASAEALMLLADLRALRGDRAGSIAALEQAVRVDERHVPARYALVATLIDEQQFDAAATQLNQARELARSDLRIHYFDAAIALGNGDLSKAREASQRILKYSPEHVPSLILAAAVELQMKLPSAAEALARRAMMVAPQHAGARRMLVRIYLVSNQPARALEALQPLLIADGEADPTLLLLAGETYLANGEIRNASSYFTAASESSAQEAIARTRLGQIALATGDVKAGLRLLEAVIAAGGAPAHADHALIAGYVRADDLDRALHAAQRLVRREPSVPLSYQLLGSVYLAKKDSAAARGQFMKALEVSPGYLPAIATLGALDIAANKPADARQRFDAVITSEPNNEQALLGLADVMAKTGADAPEIAAILRRAVRANPESVSARLALIAHHLRARELTLALAAAQEARAALPNDNRVLYALGQAQGAAGQANQAIETFNRWAALEPRGRVPIMLLAENALRQNDLQSAVSLYRTVVEQEPENFIALNNLAWAAGQIGDAKAIGYAQRAVKIAPANAAALDTLGALLLARGDATQAIDPLRKAVALAPLRPDIRFNYAKALIKAGRKDAARSELKALQAIPDDFSGKSEIAAMLNSL